jgi:hypothetical protein
MYIFIDYTSDSCGSAVCNKVCGEISLHLKCLHFHEMSLFRIGLKWIHYSALQPNCLWTGRLRRLVDRRLSTTPLAPSAQNKQRYFWFQISVRNWTRPQGFAADRTVLVADARLAENRFVDAGGVTGVRFLEKPFSDAHRDVRRVGDQQVVEHRQRLGRSVV